MNGSNQHRVGAREIGLRSQPPMDERPKHINLVDRGSVGDHRLTHRGFARAADVGAGCTLACLDIVRDVSIRTRERP